MAYDEEKKGLFLRDLKDEEEQDVDDANAIWTVRTTIKHIPQNQKF